MIRTGLPSLRTRIDRIDQQLLRWLNQRAHLAIRVGQMKQQQGKAMFDREREQQILLRVTATNGGPLSARAVGRIFQAILRECRRRECASSTRCTSR